MDTGGQSVDFVFAVGKNQKNQNEVLVEEGEVVEVVHFDIQISYRVVVVVAVLACMVCLVELSYGMDEVVVAVVVLLMTKEVEQHYYV